MTRRMAGVVCLLLWPSLAFGQSLGDAARKEQERRAKLKAEGVKARAVTEDDLGTETVAAPNPSASPKPGAAATKTPAADASPAPAGGVEDEARQRRQSEDAWRRRAALAQARLERATKRYDVLSKMALSPGEYYVDNENRPLITSVEQLQRLTAEAKAEQEAAQKAIEDLEDEARRASVPPGWLR